MISSCPPGITLQPLTAQNAPEINDVWPNRHQGSLFFIQQIIELSPSVGAFDDSGQLIAWCLRYAKLWFLMEDNYCISICSPFAWAQVAGRSSRSNASARIAYETRPWTVGVQSVNENIGGNGHRFVCLR